jgi:hypothetical protein
MGVLLRNIGSALFVGLDRPQSADCTRLQYSYTGNPQARKEFLHASAMQQVPGISADGTSDPTSERRVSGSS